MIEIIESSIDSKDADRLISELNQSLIEITEALDAERTTVAVR